MGELEDLRVDSGRLMSLVDPYTALEFIRDGGDRLDGPAGYYRQRAYGRFLVERSKYQRITAAQWRGDGRSLAEWLYLQGSYTVSSRPDEWGMWFAMMREERLRNPDTPGILTTVELHRSWDDIIREHWADILLIAHRDRDW